MERFQQGQKSQKDQEKAKDIRLKAMEKLSQTKKRKSEENSDDPPKKSRRTGSEILSFLREKMNEKWISNKRNSNRGARKERKKEKGATKQRKGRTV